MKQERTNSVDCFCANGCKKQPGYLSEIANYPERVHSVLGANDQSCLNSSETVRPVELAFIGVGRRLYFLCIITFWIRRTPKKTTISSFFFIQITPAFRASSVFFIGF